MSVLQEGNSRATLWYFTLEFLQQLWPVFLQPGSNGPEIWERALVERRCSIQSTHVEVGRVHCPAAKGGAKARNQWLKALFSAMQASCWTPDGEARTLMLKRGLSHASMSIGDIVQVGTDIYIAGLDSFVKVKSKSVAPPHDGGLAALDTVSSDEDPGAGLADDDDDFFHTGKGGSSGNYDNGAQSSGGKGKGGKGDQSESGGKRGKGGKGGKKGKGKGKWKEVKAHADWETDGHRRAAEPGPHKADKRVDRRQLRAALQAERERVKATA